MKKSPAELKLSGTKRKNQEFRKSKEDSINTHFQKVVEGGQSLYGEEQEGVKIK